MKLKVDQNKFEITAQHTYLFPITGESVTAYVSDTLSGLAFGLSFSHKGDNILWTKYYEGILQIQSQVDTHIWYMYLSAYWDGGIEQIPIERVVMVQDCNALSHNTKK